MKITVGEIKQLIENHRQLLESDPQVMGMVEELATYVQEALRPNALPDEQMSFRSEVSDNVMRALKRMTYPIR